MRIVILALLLQLPVWGQAEQWVQRVIQGKFTPADQRKLEQTGEAAVPQLIPYVKGTDKNELLAVLYLLQFVWSDAAVEPVAALLEHRDDQVVYFAILLIRRHLDEGKQVSLLKPLLKHPNRSFAAQALEVMEPRGPDLERMLGVIKSGNGRKHVRYLLARYQSPSLTPYTLKMLRSKSSESQRWGLVALIHQNPLDGDVRAAVRKTLSSKKAVVRDLAAEFLTWHGRPGDIPALRAALRNTDDRYERASIAAAIPAIERRAERHKRLSVPPIADELMTGDDACARALKLLMTKGDNAASWKRAFEFYREADAFEPYWNYNTNKVTDAVRLKQAKRLTLQGILLGFDPRPSTGKIRATMSHKSMPKASTLVPPVRDYFDPKRKSFGLHVSAKAKSPFRNSYHVGDDAAWNEDHGTVLAIAPGVVRAVWIGGSWGGIVVLEHVRADGSRFCSLYGHLSPFLHVGPGDLLEQGQKLGSLGRSFTWENGGYRCHLHFGVHDGDFGDGSWIGGYVSGKEFRRNKAGWRDPQEFLSERN